MAGPVANTACITRLVTAGQVGQARHASIQRIAEIQMGFAMEIRAVKQAARVYANIAVSAHIVRTRKPGREKPTMQRPIRWSSATQVQTAFSNLL
jgi:hypothetical protein